MIRRLAALGLERSEIDVVIPSRTLQHRRSRREKLTVEESDRVLLRIPGAIGPETMNCLLNPSHRQAAEFHVREAVAYPFDPRLKR